MPSRRELDALGMSSSPHSPHHPGHRRPGCVPPPPFMPPEHAAAAHFLHARNHGMSMAQSAALQHHQQAAAAAAAAMFAQGGMGQLPPPHMLGMVPPMDTLLPPLADAAVGPSAHIQHPPHHFTTAPPSHRPRRAPPTITDPAAAGAELGREARDLIREIDDNLRSVPNDTKPSLRRDLVNLLQGGSALGGTSRGSDVEVVNAAVLPTRSSSSGATSVASRLSHTDTHDFGGHTDDASGHPCASLTKGVLESHNAVRGITGSTDASALTSGSGASLPAGVSCTLEPLSDRGSDADFFAGPTADSSTPLPQVPSPRTNRSLRDPAITHDHSSRSRSHSHDRDRRERMRVNVDGDVHLNGRQVDEQSHNRRNSQIRREPDSPRPRPMLHNGISGNMSSSPSLTNASSSTQSELVLSPRMPGLTLGDSRNSSMADIQSHPMIASATMSAVDDSTGTRNTNEFLSPNDSLSLSQSPDPSPLLPSQDGNMQLVSPALLPLPATELHKMRPLQSDVSQEDFRPSAPFDDSDHMLNSDHGTNQSRHEFECDHVRHTNSGRGLAASRGHGEFGRRSMRKTSQTRIHRADGTSDGSGIQSTSHFGDIESHKFGNSKSVPTDMKFAIQKIDRAHDASLADEANMFEVQNPMNNFSNAMQDFGSSAAVSRHGSGASLSGELNGCYGAVGCERGCGAVGTYTSSSGYEGASDSTGAAMSAPQLYKANNGSYTGTDLPTRCNIANRRF